MRIGKIGERLQIDAVTARDLVNSDSAFKFERTRHEELLASLQTVKKAA